MFGAGLSQAFFAELLPSGIGRGAPKKGNQADAAGV